LLSGRPDSRVILQSLFDAKYTQLLIQSTPNAKRTRDSTVSEVRKSTTSPIIILYPVNPVRNFVRVKERAADRTVTSVIFTLKELGTCTVTRFLSTAAADLASAGSFLRQMEKDKSRKVLFE